MRLYGTTASPFVARVRIQVLAKSLPIELVPPPGGIGSAQLRELSPLGRIPILEAGEHRIPESSVIQEYLEDLYPWPSLRGSSPLETARVRLIARVVDIYLVPALQPLRAALVSAQPDALKDAQRGLETALDSVEAFLQGGPFTVGQELTLADCALAPLLFYVNRFARALLPDFSLQRWPKLHACEVGMGAHTAVAAVLADMTAAVAKPRTSA